MRKLVLSLTVVAAVAIAAPAVHAAKPPVTINVTISTKGVVGGVKTYDLKKGSNVLIVVRSAIGTELHLHGYDLEKAVPKGSRPVTFVFKATLAGGFDMELHLAGGHELKVLTLRIK